MPGQDQQASVPVPYRVEQQLAFSGGLVEVRRYFWAAHLEQTITALPDMLVINMALTSRPAHTRVERLAENADPLAGEAGRLLVMIPGMTYRISAPGGSFRSLHCAIECRKFEAVSGGPIDWPTLAPFGGEQRSQLGIEQHMVRMQGELARSQVGQSLVIEACSDLICVELARHFRQGRPTRPEVHVGGLATWRMRLILARIHADGPAPRITELADLCGLTERQLSRAFKAETGMTLGRFVDEVTIERGHRLLTTTSLPLSMIARELGFASSDSFAQAFRRSTGEAPGMLRKR